MLTIVSEVSATPVTHLLTCFMLSSTEAPVYLSSQSYMADSSLSEEMSQFDFSTGVQSFSFSSQNPEGQRRSAVKRVSLTIYSRKTALSLACFVL